MGQREGAQKRGQEATDWMGQREGAQKWGQEDARLSNLPWSHLSSPEAGRSHAVGSGPGSRPKKSLRTISCGLQNPPSIARKSYKAFELLRPWASCWTRAGEANIWVVSSRVWGFLSSLLDRHVPAVPSCEGSAQNHA